MKILVTGATGMLGTELCRLLRKEGHDVVAVDVCPAAGATLNLDICHFEDLRRLTANEKPDFIFHLAAETNVDLCEQDPAHAFRVNFIGTENVALICQGSGIPMVYISTAGVFDGQKSEPYDEFDEPNPINVYGKTKLAGEDVVRRLLNRYFIFRAGWMVGGWNIDKKFVYKIVQQILEGKREIKAVDDKFGCPTFTVDFSSNLIKVVETGRYGLYHLCGQSSCTRYEMARKIIEFMGVADRVEVVPISSSQFTLPAPRPRSEVMRNFKLDLLKLNHMPRWEQALRNYIVSNVNKDRLPAFP